MTFPTVSATNNGNSGANATSHAINMPSGVSVGDLIIVGFANDGNATVSVTSGSGWTQLFSTANSTTTRLSAYYKIATGSGDNLTLDTSASEGSSHISYRIVGYLSTSNPESGTAATGTATTTNPPSLNPSGWGTEDTLWIALCGFDEPVGTTDVSTWPSNYTGSNVKDHWNSSNGVGIGMGTRNLNAASDDPGTFGLANAGGGVLWVANTIAVRPLPGITADASITQGGETSSSTATNAIAGTASLTQDAESISGASTNAIAGAAAISQTAESLASAGTAAIAATGSPTQTGDSCSSGSTVSTGCAASITQGAESLASASAVAIASSASISQSAETISAASANAVAALAALTQAAETLASASTVATSAAASITQGAEYTGDEFGYPHSSAEAQVAIAATASLSEAADGLSSVGAVAISAALSRTQGTQTLNSAGAVAILALFDVTQGAETLVAVVTSSGSARSIFQSRIFNSAIFKG